MLLLGSARLIEIDERLDHIRRLGYIYICGFLIFFFAVRWMQHAVLSLATDERNYCRTHNHYILCAMIRRKTD